MIQNVISTYTSPIHSFWYLMWSVGAASGSRYVLSRRCDYAIISNNIKMLNWKCWIENVELKMLKNENDNFRQYETGLLWNLLLQELFSILMFFRKQRSILGIFWNIQSKSNGVSFFSKDPIFIPVNNQPPFGEFMSKVSNFKIFKRRRKQQTVL